MSLIKNIELIYGFNPDKMIYDIDNERNKLCFVSGNLIILKSFIEPNDIIYGESIGNIIRSIKFIKRGKYIITTEINIKKGILYTIIYKVENSLKIYSKFKNNINEVFIGRLKNIFFDINYKSDFIIILLNERNDMSIFKGNIQNQSLSISLNFYCNINGLNASIKSIKFIFEYNWLICSSKETLFSIRIISEKNNNEGNYFQIMNQISIIPFDFNPHSLNTIIDNKKNNSFNQKNPFKVIILSTNGNCNIYSTELILLKEISLKTSIVNEEINNGNDNIDFVYNFTYLTVYEGNIILGTNESKIYIYDSNSYKKNIVIDLSELNENVIMSKISFIYLNQKSDLLYIILLNGQIFLGNLSLILNKKIDSLNLLTYGHNNKIISLDISSAENNNISFYTISENGPLIKSYFNGKKFINKIFKQEKINFTVCKINPKFNNLLFLGDDMGNLYIFNIENENLTLVNIEKIVNFKIDSINFDNKKNNNYICIGFNLGSLSIYNFNTENLKCEFVLKICEDFIQNFHNKEKINSFCYFYQDTNDNRICYLSKENSISIGNLNSINNNLVLMNEEFYTYKINKFGYILDIKIHPSQKYFFILLSSNQIDVRNLDDINVRNGIINLSPYSKINKINFDITGNFMTFTVFDSFYIYNLKKNKIHNEINNLFDISISKISNDGRFIIICGKNGIICVLNNFNDIKNVIYNYKDEVIKLGIENTQKMFNLNLKDNLLKERNFSKKNEYYSPQTISYINPNSNNFQETYNQTNHKNLQNDNTQSNNYINILYSNNNLDYVKNKNLQKINVMKDFDKMNYDSPIKQRETLNFFSKSNKLQLSNLEFSNFNSNNNVFKSQTRNKNESINYKSNINNNFNKRVITHRIYPSSNYIILNKDPSIFPKNQKDTIKKINKNNYLSANDVFSSNINSYLIEKSSKKNQENIRFKNISNAISDVYGAVLEKKRKQIFRTQIPNQESFKNHIKVYPSLNNEYFHQNSNEHNFNKKSNFLNITTNNYINKNNNYNQNNLNPTYNKSNNTFNKYNSNNNKSNNKTDNSLFTENSNYYINNRSEIQKRKIFPDNESIDNVIECPNNNNVNYKNKIYKNEKSMSIDESKSNNSKKINNSIFEDIINIEKEIEKFENTHKTLFNQK